MRKRLALASLALGGTLALGGAALPAQAAELTQSAQASADATNDEPAWHFHSWHYGLTADNCIAAGEAQDLPYKCGEGYPVAGEFFRIYPLYVWY